MLSVVTGTLSVMSMPSATSSFSSVGSGAAGTSTSSSVTASATVVGSGTTSVESGADSTTVALTGGAVGASFFTSAFFCAAGLAEAGGL